MASFMFPVLWEGMHVGDCSDKFYKKTQKVLKCPRYCTSSSSKLTFSVSISGFFLINKTVGGHIEQWEPQQCLSAGSYHVTAQGFPPIGSTHKHLVGGLFPLVDHSDVIVAILNDKSKNICDILIISDHLTKCCLLSSHVLLLLTFCPLSMHSFHDTVFSTCFFCKEKKSLFPHHYKNMPCVIWLQTLDIYLRLELRIQTLSEMLPTFEGFWKLNEIRRFCPAAVTVSGSPGTIQMGACSPDKGNLFIVVSTIKQMLIDKQGLCTGRGKCQIIIVHNIVYTVHSIWRALLTHWSTAFVQTGISQKLLHGLLETLYRHSCCPRKDPLSFPLVPPWCCHFCFLCEMSWEMLDGFPWNLAYIFTVPREITTCFTDIHGPQTCSLHCV